MSLTWISVAQHFSPSALHASASLYTVHSALCTVYCALCTVCCSQCTVYLSQCVVHCALCMPHCALCIVHCACLCLTLRMPWRVWVPLRLFFSIVRQHYSFKTPTLTSYSYSQCKTSEDSYPVLHRYFFLCLEEVRVCMPIKKILVRQGGLWNIDFLYMG